MDSIWKIQKDMENRDNEMRKENLRRELCLSIHPFICNMYAQGRITEEDYSKYIMDGTNDFRPKIKDTELWEDLKEVEVNLEV